MSKKITQPERVMKKCQTGCYSLNDANDLLAECYGTIGKLLNEKKDFIETVKSLSGGASISEFRIRFDAYINSVEE